MIHAISHATSARRHRKRLGRLAERHTRPIGITGRVCDFGLYSHILYMEENVTRLGLIDEEDIVLDEAALALALLDNPETDLDPYRSFFAGIAARLRDVAPDVTSPHARADALSLVLNGEFGFTGDRDTYDDPANADLIHVIDRRRGLPISLSILYVAAARRLGWTASVLDLPGHVLVLIGEPTDPVMIDPFRDGALVHPEQLLALLSASAMAPRSDVVEIPAMPNRAILVRLLLNQAVRAEGGGRGRRALELYRRITAFAPDNGHAWWQRARLELVDQDTGGARRSLAAMLEVTREPALRVTIVKTLEALAA